MDEDVVIRAEGLGKKYVIGHQREKERYATLRDVVARNVGGLWRNTADLARGRAMVAGNTTEEFWALKDVDFEVRRGEVLGIIGRNGAGKSTLLKVLSRITEPTEGRVTIHGRLASLLEVGTGFHPELTGRENIYLNGAILGMTRAEVRRKFDEIVAFADVERFLDTPVKRYSSGMYVRLAFAVAAHLEPDILVVDEVLAVGDVDFQNKCLGKMSEVAEGGRAILFVSHNMGAVATLCHRAILLTKGKVEQSGPPDLLVRSYMNANVGSDQGRSIWSKVDGPGSDRFQLLQAYIRGVKTGGYGAATADEQVEFGCTIRQSLRLKGARLVFQLIGPSGEVAFASTDQTERERSEDISVSGTYCSICSIPPALLNNGRYTVRLKAGIPGVEVLVPDTDVCTLWVDGRTNHGSLFDETWPGAVCPRLEWRIVKVARDHF